ncbi:MAG: aminoacyl-tRNA hydrolase [Candidatus Delongbacteria bacterium]|nr:aminoacyl-tRNA hydrolase [Candidatus Delongbacteria bacterium]
MKLIVGLGNPGVKYRFTWHNLGFLAVEEAAERIGAGWKAGRGEFLTAVGQYAGDKIVLIKPTTFMNHSGTAFRQAVDFYQVELQDSLVVYDDIALPLGTLRLRASGSAGNHHGIEHIILLSASEEIPRLRIGFDRGYPTDNLSHAVLSIIPRGEMSLVKEAINRSADAMLHYLEFGLLDSMSKFNTRQQGE